MHVEKNSEVAKSYTEGQQDKPSLDVEGERLQSNQLVVDDQEEKPKNAREASNVTTTTPSIAK